MEFTKFLTKFKVISPNNVSFHLLSIFAIESKQKKRKTVTFKIVFFFIIFIVIIVVRILIHRSSLKRGQCKFNVSCKRNTQVS